MLYVPRHAAEKKNPGIVPPEQLSLSKSVYRVSYARVPSRGGIAYQTRGSYGANRNNTTSRGDDFTEFKPDYTHLPAR